VKKKAISEIEQQHAHDLATILTVCAIIHCRAFRRRTCCRFSSAISSCWAERRGSRGKGDRASKKSV